MRKKALPILIAILILVFMVGCTPAVNTQTQETSTKDMQNDNMTGIDEDTEGIHEDSIEAMSDYKDISPQEAKDLIDSTPDLVIIDVSPKYDEGHLPGSINYYVGDGSLDNAIPTLDKRVPYLVYCHVDSASISGSQKLIDAGFPTVYRLEGNYSAWVDAGYPVEK